MAKIKKSGPITPAEIEFIRLNIKDLSASEIADRLGRNVDTITKQIGQLDTLGYKSEILDLKRRADWKQIQQEFNDEELEIFKSHWNGIVQQFKEEIHYTESLQIISAIKHLLLSDRYLQDQQKIREECRKLEKDLERERNKDTPDSNIITNLEALLSSYAAAEQANGKEFREGNTKLMSVLKELKGTREQRFAKAEDMKTNFGSMMRGMIENPKIKREYGSYMEKLRLSAEKEYKKLGCLHKYMNNEFDRPILNSETVDFNGDEEIQEQILETEIE